MCTSQRTLTSVQASRISRAQQTPAAAGAPWAAQPRGLPGRQRGEAWPQRPGLEDRRAGALELMGECGDGGPNKNGGRGEV